MAFESRHTRVGANFGVSLRRLPALLAAFVALLAWSCLVASTAHAQKSRGATAGTSESASLSRSRRIVVERFKGTGDVKEVRAAAIAALEAEVTITVLPVKLLDKHRHLNDGSPEGYSALAEKLDLLAVLYGKVGKGSEGWMVALTVVNGHNGKSLGTLAYEADSLPALTRKLRSQLLQDITPILDRAAGEPEPAPVVVEPEPEPPPPPPPEEKPEPEPEPEPEKEAKPAPKPRDEAVERCPWLEVELHGGVTQRAFNFTEEQRGALRGYQLKYAPYGAARATYRPWAHRACGLASGFGIRAGYEQTFAVQSTLADQTLGTRAFAFESQVEFEFPIGIFTLTPRAGFVYRHFELTGNYVPDPRYNLVALGLEGGLRAGFFLLELGWAARIVLDAGSLQSADWFPGASGFGWQGEARIGAAPTRWLDAFVLGEYESYSFDLNPSAPGQYPFGVAQGSYDRYLRVGIGVRFNVPSRAAAK
jgi:hypothetical protein